MIDNFVVVWFDVFAGVKVIFSIAAYDVGLFAFAAYHAGRFPDTLDGIVYVDWFVRLEWAEVFRRSAIILRCLGYLTDCFGRWVGIVERSRSVVSSFFMVSKAFWFLFSQWKWMSFFVSSRRGAVRSAILAENRLRYVIMPRAVSSSLLLVGAFRFVMASNFSVAGSEALTGNRVTEVHR